MFGLVVGFDRLCSHTDGSERLALQHPASDLRSSWLANFRVSTEGHASQLMTMSNDPAFK